MLTENKDIKFLTKPILIVFFIAILIGAVLSVGYNQVSALYQTTVELKENQLKLAEKLGTLESVRDILNENISYVDVALPYKASVLYGLSQVKNLALRNRIIVTNLKAGSFSLEDNGISKSSLSFEAEGLDADLQQFMLSFYNALPLMTVDKVKINKADGLSRANITVYVYSADLPEKIPAVTESVSGLSNTDIQTLNRISNYIEPLFFEPKANKDDERTDPFTSKIEVIN